MSLADGWFETQSSAYPALAERYQKLADLHTRKLWHQLTEEVAAFVADDTCCAAGGANLLALLADFVSTFQTKINAMSLATMYVTVAGKAHAADPVAAAALLSTLLEALGEAKLGVEGFLLLTFEVARCQVAQGGDAIKTAKTTLDERKAQLEALVGAPTAVYAAYYVCLAAYYKLVGPAEKFYSAALSTLGYVPVESMSVAAAHELAVDLALAALAGRTVFNFGEVIATPILGALAGTSEAWLGELLHALNRGDIDRFNELLGANEAAFAAQPALAASREFVKEKAALLAITELLFHRPADARTVAFADVAAATRMGVEQVEWMLMRAMSLKLIKGVIDQVQQIVTITYVAPRVLETEQIAVLKERLEGWSGKVDTTLRLIKDETIELFQ